MSVVARIAIDLGKNTALTCTQA